MNDPATPADRGFRDALRTLAFVLAGFALGFVASKALGLPWRSATIAFGVVVAGVTIGSSRPMDARRTFGWTLTGLAALVVARLVPLLGAIAPPGGDMSMHALLVRVALEHSVLPSTQVPLYAGVPYGAYPLGFHGVAALLASTGLGLTTACVVLIAATHALFAAGVAVNVSRWTSPGIAAVTALVATAAVRNPQAYVGWGGNPCVLGFAFALFAWDTTWRALDAPSWRPIVRAVVLVAATAITHATAGIVLGVALVVLTLVRFVRLRDPRIFLTAVLVAVPALVLVVPVVRDILSADFSDGERAWIRVNHFHPPQSPPLRVGLLPDYWKYLGGDISLVLGGLGFVAALRRRWRRALVALFLLIVLPYVVIAFRHGGLPGDTVVYPERALLVLILPWSFLVGELFAWARDRWNGQHTRRGLVRFGLGAAAMAITAAGLVNAVQYYGEPAGVRSVDVLENKAFVALASVADADTRVVNRVGDAASFLPSLHGIAVTNPQWHPVWRDELGTWRSTSPPDFVVRRGGERSGTTLPTRPWRAFTADGDTVWIDRITLSPTHEGLSP